MIALKYFLKQCLNNQKRDVALRATYVILSHSFVILDYILKDIAFLESQQRKLVLNDGFKYGNLGRKGANKTIEMALKIGNSSLTVNQIQNSLDSSEFEMLSEFYSKVETIKNIFQWAKYFEEKAFEKSLVPPASINPEYKSPLALMLDFFDIQRKEFFA